jgi:hypothetical protein
MGRSGAVHPRRRDRRHGRLFERVGTAGWQHGSPVSQPDDELTRIAEDQGWDSSEVDAIRSLLDPAPQGTTASEAPEPVPSGASAYELGRTDSQAAEPDVQSAEADAQPPEAERAQSIPTEWPAADHSVTFTLPGGDELQQALEALGLPTPSRTAKAEASEPGATPEQPETPEPDSTPERAQPHEWSKVPPAESAAAVTPETALRRSLAAAADSQSASQAEPPKSADGSPPTGEPEWLRGRRDPAARAFRRLRRIFPN